MQLQQTKQLLSARRAMYGDPTDSRFHKPACKVRPSCCATRKKGKKLYRRKLLVLSAGLAILTGCGTMCGWCWHIHSCAAASSARSAPALNPAAAIPSKAPMWFWLYTCSPVQAAAAQLEVSFSKVKVTLCRVPATGEGQAELIYACRTVAIVSETDFHFICYQGCLPSATLLLWLKTCSEGLPVPALR